MSQSHDHPHHDHKHEPVHVPARTSAPEPPETPEVEDSSTRALSDALRSSFFIVKVLMVFLVIAFAISGLFEVKPHERVVVFRLGKPVGTPETMLRGPGFHWSFPYPIDVRQRISIGEVQSVESTVAWYAVTDGQESWAGPSLNPAVDGYALTADGNIIHARATLRYRITDPLAYAFNFTDAANIVQNALNNALVYASAHYTVDRAIRFDRTGFKERVAARVNQLVNAHELGITLETPDVVTVAPRQLKEKFEEVSAAEQNRDRTILEARKEADTLLSKAQGEADTILNEGQSDRARLVSSLSAEAQYLQDRLPEYQKNPELFRERMIAETMRRILSNPQVTFVFPDDNENTSRELRLQLGRQPQRPKTPEPEN